MKIWLLTLLLLPTSAWSQAEVSNPVPLDNSTETPSHTDTQQTSAPNWIDTSHSAATTQTQNLAQWMDDFFGDSSYEFEKAESFLRIELEHEWDEEFGSDIGIKLRGKVQLPRISKRLDLVFSDSDDDLGEGEGANEKSDTDKAGLQYKVREGKSSRFDATMGFASGNLKPGVRYRTEHSFNDRQSYRYVQRIQYEDDEKFFTLGQVDLFNTLSDNKIVRWSNRFKWGERTDGVEWRSRLSLFQRKYTDTERPVALNYFATVTGRTRPHSYRTNYKLGVLWRRQIYRDYLFFEVEPAFNYRRQGYDESRTTAWSLVMRLEIALQKDLITNREK